LNFIVHPDSAGANMEVKGTAVIPMREYVKKTYGSRYQEWINSLSRDSQNILNAPLSSCWYPIKPGILEPTQKICDLFHGGKDDGALQVGRFSADEGLKGLYAVFLKVGSPGFIVSRGSRVITQYYKPCELKVVESCSDHATVQIVEFPEPSRLIELRIAGWMGRAIELTGKTNTVKINKSMAGGDAVTEFEVRWG
jgi:hypothetical protein